VTGIRYAATMAASVARWEWAEVPENGVVFDAEAGLVDRFFFPDDGYDRGEGDGQERGGRGDEEDEDEDEDAPVAAFGAGGSAWVAWGSGRVAPIPVGEDGGAAAERGFAVGHPVVLAAGCDDAILTVSAGCARVRFFLGLQQRQSSRFVELAFPEPLYACCACAVAKEKLDVLVAAVVFAGGAVRLWRVSLAAAAAAAASSSSFSVPSSSSSAASSSTVVRLGFGAIDPPTSLAFLFPKGLGKRTLLLAISEAQVRAVSDNEEDAAWAARNIAGASQGCVAVLDDVLVLGDGGRVVPVAAVPTTTPGRDGVGPGSEGNLLLLPSSLPILASAGEEAAVALGAFRGAGAGSPPQVRGGV